MLRTAEVGVAPDAVAVDERTGAALVTSAGGRVQVTLRQPHLRLHRRSACDQVAGEDAPLGDLSELFQRRQRL